MTAKTVKTALRTARTILSLAAVSLVATAVVGAGGTSSATGDHHSDVAQAAHVLKSAPGIIKPGTKEW